MFYSCVQRIEGPGLEYEHAYIGLCSVLQLNQLKVIVASKENYYSFMKVCANWDPQSSESGNITQIHIMLTQIVQHLRANYVDMWKWYVNTSMTNSTKDRRNTELIMKMYNVSK